MKVFRLKQKRKFQEKPPLFDIRAIDSNYHCYISNVSGSYEEIVIEIPPTSQTNKGIVINTSF